MYVDNILFFSNKPHCNTTIRVEKGQKSWFGIIIKYMCIYTNCLKKGGETSKSKIHIYTG